MKNPTCPIVVEPCDSFKTFILNFEYGIRYILSLHHKMSFFHSNLGFWSKFVIIELDYGCLTYSTQISSNQSGITIVVSYALTSSYLFDSASTTTMSFPFFVLFPYQRWKVFPSIFVVQWTTIFTIIGIDGCCD
jgi:hypothetical protein